MLRILCLIAIIAVALADAGKSITASVKDTAVNGVEGLNIKWSAPFKFQDYVVGFRTTLGDLRRAPEELFAKRSFNTGGDSTATVDADYNIESKRLNLNAKWSNEKIDLGAEGNSEDKLTSLSASTNTQLNGNNLNVGAVYDMMKRRITGSSELEVDDTKFSL
jgi:hypothetical protein